MLGRQPPITTATRHKCFASYMRIHALEASGGLTYAQLGRYLDQVRQAHR